MEIVTKEILTGDLSNCLIFQKEGTTRTVPQFVPGIYTIRDISSMFSTQVVYQPIKPNENYVDFTGGTVGLVLNKAKTFFNKDVIRKYNELDIAHKTGIILEGPPGTGKTVTAHIIMKQLVFLYDAICLVAPANMKPYVWRFALKEIKKLNKPIILFIDECDYSFSCYENEWLTFLDGHESYTNFMFIGCTNHISDISARLKRPSRIEHLVHVDSIEAEVAAQYVKAKLPMIPADIRTGLAYEAVEMKATMDIFKHAIKEFYIYTKADKVDVFKDILKSLQDSRNFSTVE